MPDYVEHREVATGEEKLSAEAVFPPLLFANTKLRSTKDIGRWARADRSGKSTCEAMTRRCARRERGDEGNTQPRATREEAQANSSDENVR